MRIEHLRRAAATREYWFYLKAVMLMMVSSMVLLAVGLHIYAWGAAVFGMILAFHCGNACARQFTRD